MTEPTWKAVTVVFPNESFWMRFKIWLELKALFEMLPNLKDDELTDKGRELRKLSKES